MTADVQWSIQWIRDVAAQIAARKSELTTLDREIGDADHGENLNRGFTAVVDRLESQTLAPETVGDVLKVVATTLMSTVGGAAGPLYGTAFLRASKVCDSAELTPEQAVGFVEAALEGIQVRGKATTGEKTMVDAWSPALDAAREALANGADVAHVFEAAAQAALAGAEATIAMKATKGRASYLGERSVGHKDPGATSTGIILESAARTVQ